MRLLDIVYEGWGEQWRIGRLAHDGQHLLFEYGKDAFDHGLALSPNLPLQPGAFQGYGEHQFGLPGAIADALPDGWGLLVMDRLFRKCGKDPRRLSPLDRLAFIGDRGMGALTFRPDEGMALSTDDLSLLELAAEVRQVVHDKDTAALPTLARLGGSPQGARPKALVNFNPESGMVSTQALPGGEPWLVKFQAGNEHPEVCAVETLYANLAEACGIEMPQTRLFELGAKLSAFGIKRFDRHAGMRVPTLTAAGAIDLNFRLPQMDYADLLRLTRALTRSQAEVNHAFRRAVFNVVFNNRDDHSKNVSYRLDRQGAWKLAPGYDLTFSDGPGGEHHMDVYGEARHIGRALLLRLAAEHDVPTRLATGIIEQACDVASGFAGAAADYPIRKATRQGIAGRLKENLARMGSDG
ncbi:type II toxin-antitoxin system HipA family toxin [Stenotrophomonas sp.]|uniref:type II toxin-antitoxin system HipA family toxin n=1 Tax=Stenotrophomonas sp. TaxID=69392 RepID=UPI002FC8212B